MFNQVLIRTFSWKPTETLLTNFLVSKTMVKELVLKTKISCCKHFEVMSSNTIPYRSISFCRSDICRSISSKIEVLSAESLPEPDWKEDSEGNEESTISPDKKLKSRSKSTWRNRTINYTDFFWKR